MEYIFLTLQCVIKISYITILGCFYGASCTLAPALGQRFSAIVELKLDYQIIFCIFVFETYN